MLAARKIKDPNEVLDYRFAWGETHAGEPPWLQPGETISSKTVTVPAGLTLESSEIAEGGQSVIAWLSGGAVLTNYVVTCQIITNASRTGVRSMTVSIQNR